MRTFHCGECGNNGSDGEIIMIEEVVGRLIVGLGDDGVPIVDSEPLCVLVGDDDGSMGPSPTAPVIASRPWCSACGSTPKLHADDRVVASGDYDEND